MYLKSAADYVCMRQLLYLQERYETIHFPWLCWIVRGKPHFDSCILERLDGTPKPMVFHSEQPCSLPVCSLTDQIYGRF